MTEDFELDISVPWKADVYVDVSNGDDVPWPDIAQLDQAGIRSIADLPDARYDDERVRRIMSGCSAVMTDQPSTMRLAEDLMLPIHDSVGAVVTSVAASTRIRPYAFLIGRLERDFAHAREAMRVAVEREAGIPLVWIDDGRHRTNVEGVRESTRLLIRHTAFVIADLTLGVESPDRENPSRAHEIGMAVAYERRVMLTSQEPRRYPYFSIGDMQMAFWETEDELERIVGEWVRAAREWVSRRVLNAELPSVGHVPKITPPMFRFDPAKRFIGPNLEATRALRVLPR